MLEKDAADRARSSDPKARRSGHEHDRHRRRPDGPGPARLPPGRPGRGGRGPGGVARCTGRGAAARSNDSTGPDQIPRKPFGSTEGAGLGHRHRRLQPRRRAIATRRPIAHRPRGDRRRRQLLRQRLGVPRRPQRGVDGPGLQGPARQGLPDDQGLHARPRQEGGHAAARGVAASACRPITSTCGRSTKCVYDNDPELHFAKGGVIEALDEAKKAGQGALRRLHRPQAPAHPPEDARRTTIPFDTVQMPLNCFDATYRSFETAGAAGGRTSAAWRRSA